MPRIRSIKPEIWVSPQIMNLTHSARLLFIGLITQADDEGRGTADPRRLKASIFGGDTTSVGRISSWLRSIAAQQLVSLYESADHGHLYELTSWKSHQRIDRPKPSEYPPPANSRARNGRGAIDDHSTSDQRGIVPDRILGSDRKDRKDRIGSDARAREAAAEAPPRAVRKSGQESPVAPPANLHDASPRFPLPAAKPPPAAPTEAELTERARVLAEAGSDPGDIALLLKQYGVTVDQVRGWLAAGGHL